MSDNAKQYPQRQRRAKHGAAPDGAGPIAYARGTEVGPVADALGIDRGLDLHKQLSATTTPVDRLVYELCGLADDEIRIVEERTGR